MDIEKKAERIPPVLWIGFVIVFAFLLAAGVLFYRGQHRRLQQEAIDMLRSIAELKSAEIFRWRKDCLTDAVDDTRNPSMDRLLRDWLSSRDAETAEELLVQLDFIKESYGYLHVRIVDPEGRRLLSTTRHDEPVAEAVSAALQTAIRERRPVLTEFHLDPDEIVPHIGSIVPVFASEAPGSVCLGAMISAIDPRIYLYPLIQSWPTPSPSAETLLVVRDGDNALFLNELRHRKGTALKLRIPLNQKEVPAAMAAQGRTGPVEGLDYRGAPVLAIIFKIPDSPWFMVSKVDRTEAFAGWSFQAALIIALILALIAAAAAAFLLLWQRGVKAHYRALHETEAARDLSEARYLTTLLSIGDGVIVTDIEGKLVFINPTAERLTGWNRTEAKSLPLEKVFHIINEETRLPVENPVRRVIREGLVVGLANHTLLVSRDGREIPIADSGAPVRFKNGPITGVVLVFSDQTAARSVENEMRRNETRLRSLISILQHPAESVQEYLDFALAEALALTGSELGYIYHYFEDRRQFILNTWSREVMKECTIADPATVYDLDKTGIWGEAVRQRRPIVVNDFAAAHPLKKGYPEGHASLRKYLTVPVFQGQAIVAVVGVANKSDDYADEDVLQLTLLMESIWRVIERMRTEDALRESEKKFRSVFDLSNIGKSLTRPAGDVFPNQSLCRMLGYSEEGLKAKKWQDLTPPEDVETVANYLKPIYAGETDTARFEKRYVRKDGSIFWGDVSVATRRDHAGKLLHFITAVVDIDQRKKAEEALRQTQARQQAILASVPDIIMEVDERKVYTWANAAGLEFFGSDVVGREAADYFEGEQDTYETVKPLFNGHEEIIYVESRQRRRDGKKRLLAWWCRVLKGADGRVLGAISTARDITEHQEAEEKIRQSLKEREVMLREIHHRVKNNIQIVSSLLRLQSRRLDDARARDALAESQNRIRSMALIHEKLYQTGDFARIHLGDYFESMSSHLLAVYREHAAGVRIQVEAQDFRIDINRAVPLGLIFNELVTNALKHAFPGGRDGKILARLSRMEDEKYELKIKDTGIGFPDPGRLQNGNSLGLEIVRDLVQQIDGTLEIHNDGGAEITIRF